MEDFDRDMFDDLMNVSSNEDLSLCQHDIRIIDGYHTCILCGVVDINRLQFHESTQRAKSYFIYHRKSYFREKLRLLSCIKQSTNDEYNNVLAKLKDYQFETIFELKRIMRRLKLSKYYKYIYCIYYDLKRIKLFPLNINEIERLIHEFIKLERQFKMTYPKKHNLLSYNIVIYCICKKNNYAFYKHILLPKNRKKILKLVNNLLNL